MDAYKKIAAAAIIFAAAACTRNEPEQAPVQVPENGNTITLTANLPDTKGYDVDGKVKWEVGDVIVIATNLQRITTDGSEEYAALVTLTDENIITPTTASFEVSGAAFDGATKIYAAAVSGFNSWKDVVYGMAVNGLLTTKKVTDVFVGKRPHLAYAATTSEDRTLHFANVGCVIKWTTKTSKTIHHVSFYDNDGSRTGMSFRVAADGTISTNPNPTYDSYAVRSFAVDGAWTAVSGAADGPYFLFLAPGKTYANGVTLYAYGSGKDETSGPVSGELGKVVINKSFSTVAGRIYDFGIIEDHYHFATYKEAYDAGQTIKVGDLEVNKATFGASQLITSDSRFYPVSGVAFVDPSAVNANLQYWSATPKCIVIGNDPQQRSNLEIRAQGNFQDGQVVAFKNLNIKLGDGFSNPWMAKTNNGDVLDWFAIDNCRVDFQTRLVELPNNGINNFSITDSDIVVLDGSGPNDVHRAIICRGTESEYVGTRLVFRNNLVTTESTTAKGFCLINNDATKLSFSTVDISFNTIHNVQNAGYYFVSLANIGTSVTMTKNLLWKGGSFNWIQLYGLADGASASFDYAGVTDNKLEGWILRAKNGDAIVATGTAGWYQQKDENYPFAAGDLATVISTRNYTPIAALSGYGVTNPKRLQ